MEDMNVLRDQVGDMIFLLKDVCGISVRKLSAISKSRCFGKKFSDTLLIKVYKKSSTSEYMYSDVSHKTILWVRYSLASIFKYACTQYPELEKTCKKKNSKLFNFIKRDEVVFVVPTHVSLIRDEGMFKNNESNTISWDTSLTYELSASEVLTVTANLFWLCNTIEKLIPSIKKGASFYYILTDGSDELTCEWLRKFCKKHSLGDSLQIRLLWQDDACPFPSDVVLCDQLGFVRNCTEARIFSREYKLNKAILIDDVQVEVMISWFVETWDTLENKVIV